MIYAPVGVEPAHVLRVPKQQLYACLHYQLELYLETEHARGQSGHVLIFDLAEFGWRHLHRRFLTQVVQLVGVLLKNYPEMITKLAIVNAPGIFSIAWKAILPFANEHVQSKISITRGPNTEMLLDLVGPEGLPADMGGSVAETLESVPAAASGGASDEAVWTEVTIDAGKTERHVVKVEAHEPAPDGSVPEPFSLAVEFSVESAEISFMAVYEPPQAEGAKKGGEQEYAIEPETYNASGGNVSKLVEGARPGTYTFVWDNTQAWRYPRNVSYRVLRVSGSVQGVEADETDDTSRLSRLPEWDGLTAAEMQKLAASEL